VDGMYHNWRYCWILVERVSCERHLNYVAPLGLWGIAWGHQGLAPLAT
jgi:hypothetical protein